ncbi:hypothetical protein [Granulicella mallensis]|uniref:Uncharacterized protein n=1 Tax=Granulicella mallensis (strain ATCC BAA-1857 / DSM 23137 / MP5ACTX8) TaxID=682795 RepID=G8NX49_GRAMM|nr:hypothetical protein [Granulicella mallensis]AEU36663.1 hypothetical protein AciX8_2346 [Granulicella mallensis MP5ACTX8]
MQLTGIDLVFWAAGFLAHAVLLVVLWTRHRATVFPFFTTLITEYVVRTITLYFIVHYGTKHQYLLAYLSLGTVDLALQLCVVYELASHIFRPLGKWAPDVRGSFGWLIGGSIIIASALTWLTAPPANSWMRAVLIRGNFFSSVLMSELFVGMIALSATVGLPWKTHVARISQGLGLYSIIGILTEAGHSYLGMDHHARMSANLSYIRISSYLACQVYWIIMLWREAPASLELPEEMREQLAALQRRVEYDLRELRSWRP